MEVSVTSPVPMISPSVVVLINDVVSLETFRLMTEASSCARRGTNEYLSDISFKRRRLPRCLSMDQWILM